MPDVATDVSDPVRDLVRDAELLTAGVDEVVVTATTDPGVEVTTRVGDAEVVTAGPFHTARFAGLTPGTDYGLSVEGAEPHLYLPPIVRTLEAPPGELLATVATVNDVHFGETEAGLLGQDPNELGPVFRAEPGDDPYPEVMNRAVIDEIATLDPDAVVIKGDLTNAGLPEEYRAFLDAYGALGERMRHVRGNHDAMTDPNLGADDAPFVVEVPGVRLAVLDTVIPGDDMGRLDAEQLEWLDTLAAESSTPVLVFGHHHPWEPGSEDRPNRYFGINPPDSEALVSLIGRRPAIAGYFAGHTHRNRVRRFPDAREIPIVEVACAKDFPGVWAEYRIHEGGYTQVVRRVDAPDARAWAERTRGMFMGLYRDYALGDIDDRCFLQRF
ncbi:MAG: metallophosphoesterase [Acidimicrobiia bacterium]|nr:metallophosphoesterase [Acidimicrobiia bacterium]